MNPSTCPSCRQPVPADAPAGICPACALLGAAQPTVVLPQQGALSMDEVAAAFPDLEILGMIGQGGMGVVYKARQPRLDRLVALKLLPPHLAAQPGFSERFTREAQALAKLSHPHIVGVYDFGGSGGFFYLLMEYVDGVNLRQAIRAGITPEQALILVPLICGAVQFAHDRGVLHRDIKPENILLDREGTPKLADFGIAKLSGENMSGLTLSGASLGTAAYMAPEQVEKPATVDHRADIYSLGVVFYEMLTGELPLGRFAVPSEKSKVGEGVDTVVMRALEKERERRQQSAGEMKTQVEGVQAAGTMSASPGLQPPPIAPVPYQEKHGKAVRILQALCMLSGAMIPVSAMLRFPVGPREFTGLAIVFGVGVAIARLFGHHPPAKPAPNSAIIAKGCLLFFAAAAFLGIVALFVYSYSRSGGPVAAVHRSAAQLDPIPLSTTSIEVSDQKTTITWSPDHWLQGSLLSLEFSGFEISQSLALDVGKRGDFGLQAGPGGDGLDLQFGFCEKKTDPAMWEQPSSSSPTKIYHRFPGTKYAAGICQVPAQTPRLEYGVWTEIARISGVPLRVIVRHSSAVNQIQTETGSSIKAPAAGSNSRGKTQPGATLPQPAPAPASGRVEAPAPRPIKQDEPLLASSESGDIRAHTVHLGQTVVFSIVSKNKLMGQQLQHADGRIEGRLNYDGQQIPFAMLDADRAIIGGKEYNLAASGRLFWLLPMGEIEQHKVESLPILTDGNLKTVLENAGLLK